MFSNLPWFVLGTTNKHECVLPHVWVSGGDEEITFPIQTCTRAGDVRNAQWRAVRSIDDALQMTWVQLYGKKRGLMCALASIFGRGTSSCPSSGEAILPYYIYINSNLYNLIFIIYTLIWFNLFIAMLMFSTFLYIKWLILQPGQRSANVSMQTKLLGKVDDLTLRVSTPNFWSQPIVCSVRVRTETPERRRRGPNSGRNPLVQQCMPWMQEARHGRFLWWTKCMAVKIAHQKGARYLLSVRFLVMFVHVCYDGGRRFLMIFVCGLKSCGAVQVLQ